MTIRASSSVRRAVAAAAALGWLAPAPCQSAAQSLAPGASVVLPYGGHAREQARLSLPAAATGAVKGLLVHVHSGGWGGGDMEQEEAALAGVRRTGFATLNLNYPLLPDGAFPRNFVAVLSALAAVHQGGCPSTLDTCSMAQNQAWVQAADFARSALLVSGFSAGGYLAVAAAGHIAARPDNLVRCVLSIAGPMDLRNPVVYDPEIWGMAVAYAGALTQRPDGRERISPAWYVESAQWPVHKLKWYFVSAAQDNVVPPGQLGFTPHATPTASGAVAPMVAALLARHARVSWWLEQGGDVAEGHRISTPHMGQYLAQFPSYCLSDDR